MEKINEKLRRLSFYILLVAVVLLAALIFMFDIVF